MYFTFYSNSLPIYKWFNQNTFSIVDFLIKNLNMNKLLYFWCSNLVAHFLLKVNLVIYIFFWIIMKGDRIIQDQN